MVTECAILSENLLARAPGRDGVKNPVQFLPQLSWFHTRLKLLVHVLLMTAFMVPMR